MRALLLVLAACGGSSTTPGDAARDSSPDAPRALPSLVGSEQLCKLLSDLNTADPTPNDVQHRANILGADLGIPVEHAGTLYIFFGDTIGYAGIWGPTDSHPDSVGFGLDSASAIALDPSLLCRGLRVLTLSPGESRGPMVDPTVQADFAAGAMAAPSGHQLGEYIRNPSGSNAMRFPFLPGDFEVPSGAFSHGDSIYVFYTTVESTTDITMKASYLARWSNPSPAGRPGYQVLYGVDERFDAAGALGGDFINIAAVAHAGAVYLFGTGDYRRSPVHLAKKSLDALDAPGFEKVADPIIATTGYGETSVRYFASIDRWMFLAEELTPTTNHIVARFADRPEGPWSDAIVVNDMADPAFRAAYCCTPDNNCTGQQFFNCDRTGFYGAYLLPEVTRADGKFTVTYTMSSFDPYNVALFTATFTE